MEKKHQPPTPPPPPANIFAALCDFGLSTRTIRMAKPEDILSGCGPDGNLPPFELRPGAPTTEVTIRPLTVAQRAQADAILDAVRPPPRFREEPAERPSLPPRRVPDGYDDEDPDYLTRLREMHDRQAAFAVLHGMVGLMEDTPGATVENKIDTIISTMPFKLISYLASTVWNMTYAEGDPGDFFTRPGSISIPSSEPTPKKPPRATKRK